MGAKIDNHPEYDLPAGLAQPAVRALTGAGYTRLEQLAGVPEADILKLHGMGPNAMRILRTAFAERGLAFADAQ
jgi:hypothetical protein